MLQGLKPRLIGGLERAKPEGLAYLEATTEILTLRVRMTSGSGEASNDDCSTYRNGEEEELV